MDMKPTAICILFVAGLFDVVAAATVINVEPGPDAIPKAQQKVRALMRKDAAQTRLGGVEVVLADGLYRLEKPIALAEIDCGTNGIPVVWRAANRGKAIISGSVEAKQEKIDWSRMPASLIPEESRANVRAYCISGTNSIPGWRNGWRQTDLNETPIQVHVGGERCKVATWPKKEYARTGQPVTPIVDSINQWGENWYASFGGDFHLLDVPQLDKWAQEPDLWAFGMWRFEWCATTAPVLKIDPVEKVMCVATNQNPYGFLPNRPYNVFNAFSEIKAKGDWAIDRKSRTLYVFQDDDAPVEVSLTPSLFIGGASIHDVEFRDFVFEHSRREAMRFYHAKRVVIRACLFRGIGDTAVVMGGDSRNSIVHGCDFYDLGKGAVKLSGGVQKTLVAASNVVENCHIHHFGVVTPIAQPAITMSGVGNRAEHNLIHHFSHQGITYNGNDHYCGFNVLHDGVMYNNDAGMIYCSSYDWSKRGSVCEYNCIFMAGKQPLSSHVQGIYMDGWTSGITLRGNIVNRASQGIYTSGGNDNIVVENLIVNCQQGINLSSLGADSFAKAAALQGEKSFLYKKLLAGRELYETELWRKRYPRILDILAMTNKVDAHNAYWYTCTNNVMCATQGLRVGNKEKVLPTHFMKDNLELEGDPGFIDYEGFNWELKPDAPARKVLPNGTRFAEMGLYDSPWRFSPAVKHGEGMSRPRPIRTEFDQGDVMISVILPKGGGRWHSLSTATPEWREFAYEEVVQMDGDYRIALIGGQGYKTMYDDVRIEGHPEIDGTFERDDKSWTWDKNEKPSTKGEKGTPHGVVETDEAASGRHVAMANNKNFVVSKVFKMKKGDTLRVVLKAKQYVPDFIRPYWKSADGGISVELPKDPCDTLRIAADEFRKYHQLVTGTEAKGERRIRLKVDPKLSPDGNDTYTIVSDAQGATLTGDKPRCVLYAVYDLLERRAGCRWFWDGDVVPKRDAIDLSGLDVREHSRFEFRATRFFSHRGLTRFRAQQWGPEDWIREIDYLAKIRINCVMLRIGWDDIFQKAFPDVCEYPDPSKPLPGTGEGYDNHSLFWSLQFRGLLRSMIHERAFKRGMSIPEDFGTMTHWYSRTPQDFLDKMKPDFLPQATEWYQEPSGLVWDIRQKKWMEAYWKLTAASIRAYGKPDVLHTMGLSERTCSTNAEENLQMKIDVMRRLCADARARYPNSHIILGGWDFHFTWEPEECRRLWPALADLGGLLLWDYESDEVRNKGPATKCLRTNILSNWDVIGKFPYTFGIFAYAASSADIRANYPAIEREWAKSADDPFCKGYIWWPEVEHNDILFYRYFAVNSWRGGHKVQELLPDFCIDRYGVQAKAMEEIWRKTLPIVTGLDYCRLAAKPITHLPTIFDRTDSWRKVPWRAALNDAPKVYRAFAAIDWQDDFTRRDTIDIARTVADRMIFASLSKMYYAYQRWNGGEGEADELLRWTETSRALVEAFADTLALHTDYSLWESYLRLDKVEKVRNPNFPQVLLENASCGYCRGYQYECAAHWYVPVMRDVERAIKAKVASGKRGGTLAAPRTDYHGTLLATPLKKLAPASPRTPEAYRKTMLRFAETLEKMLPCQPERDDATANATDEILM